jgi:hypothetical protein
MERRAMRLRGSFSLLVLFDLIVGISLPGNTITSISPSSRLLDFRSFWCGPVVTRQTLPDGRGDLGRPRHAE